MTKINATKGEFVNLINGLFQVQDLKGKKFGLAVSKNIAKLKEELQHLEDLGKPSEEFMKLAMKVNELTKNNSEDSQEEINKLEKREQMEKVNKVMQDKMSIKLVTISEDILPDDISAKQINNIEKIIL